MILDIIECVIVFIALIVVCYSGSASNKCIEASIEAMSEESRLSLRNTSIIFSILSIVAMIVLGMVIISIESFKII